MPKYYMKLPSAPAFLSANSVLSLLTVLLYAIAPSRIYAQDMKGYEGHWESPLPTDHAFTITAEIRQTNDSTAILTLSGTRSSVSREFHFEKGQPFAVTFGDNLTVKGLLGLSGLSFVSTPSGAPGKSLSRRALRVFIQSGPWQYHLTLHPSGPHRFSGKWNILLADHFRSPFYLSIENPAGEQYEAYAFSPDHRFPGFACYNFTKAADSIHFNDFRTGLEFSGRLRDKTIALTIKMAGIGLAEMILRPSTRDWQLDGGLPEASYHSQPPANMHDGLPTGDLHQAGFSDAKLRSMVDSIHANKITRTQGILIARKGRLVYEQYFDGFDAATPHDMRSASKSISSALIGIAIDQGILRDTGQRLFDLLPPKYRPAADSDFRKRQISIGNLLTMSSGLDAIDFGTDRKSAASEDVYQPTPDWIRTVVEAPLIHQPGSHANYGSANPFLLGVILNTRLNPQPNSTPNANPSLQPNASKNAHAKQPLEFFIDDNLFDPLGIDTYIIQNDCFGNPYFGGGMFLRPRDMLKFGLLYAQNGRWKDRQLISQKWVEASFSKYLVLENHPEKNEYGFLWWHYSYQVGNKTIRSIEARGAGGQYIFIIPDYQLVVVITSANFRNGRVWQPEKIMENYILPALQ